ncbi:MAG: MarR family winged helix-turn-helix transcriptional regulator [Actinomycetota bacterium]
MPDQDTDDSEERGRQAGRLALAIGRINRLLRAGDGINHSGLSALSSIVRYGPLRLNELAQREGVAPATVTRIAVDLGRLGFTTRTTDTADRRATMIKATPAGVDFIMQARSARADIMAGLLGTIDAHEVERLIAALPALEAIVSASMPPPVA